MEVTSVFIMGHARKMGAVIAYLVGQVEIVNCKRRNLNIRAIKALRTEFVARQDAITVGVV